MSELSNYKEIIDGIFTVAQKNTFVNAVQHAIDASFDQNKEVRYVLDMYIPYFQTDQILSLAQSLHVDLRNQETASSFYKELLNVLNQLKEVDLTIAYTPNYDQIKRIAEWWRKEVDPYIILNLKFDRDLIAGAIVGYDGVSKNVSLREHMKLN